MVLNRIEKLLEKYENGETTLKEEQQLMEFFLNEEVPTHLEHYKPMFHYFSKGQKEEFTGNIPLKTKKTTKMYQWISVAAAVILMFGMYFSLRPSEEVRTIASLTEQERMEYDQAMEALGLLSKTFKKGTDNLAVMSHLSESFEVSNNQIEHLAEFERSTPEIFKSN